LYKAYLKEQSTQSLQLYKAYRNKLAAILRKAEKEYYLTKFENVKDNLSKTWKILNSVILRTKNKVVVPEIVSNNQTISDPRVIDNKFNFFANVAKMISPTTKNFNDFLLLSNRDSIF